MEDLVGRFIRSAERCSASSSLFVPFGQILTPASDVHLTRRQRVVRLNCVGLGGIEHALQIGTAPSASSPCSATFAQLARPTRTLKPQEAFELSARNMETEAYFIVEIHYIIINSGTTDVVTGRQWNSGGGDRATVNRLTDLTSSWNAPRLSNI